MCDQETWYVFVCLSSYFIVLTAVVY